MGKDDDCGGKLAEGIIKKMGSQDASLRQMWRGVGLGKVIFSTAMNEIRQSTDIFDVAILPYVDFQEPLRFGNIQFWNYIKEKDIYCKTNQKLKDRITELTNAYRNFYDIELPIKTVSVASIYVGDDIKWEIDEHDHEILLDGINLIAYYHQQNSARFFPSSYDNFIPSLFTLNLKKDSGMISFETRTGLRMMDVGTLKIQTPLYLDVAKVIPEKTKNLLSALESLFDISRDTNNQSSKEAKRIIRSIGWFNQSKYADPLITNQVQLVMIATALETLFDVQPFESKTKQLTMGLQLLLGENELLTHWLKDFYASRGNVVHGQNVKHLKYGVNTSHVILGQIVFHYCLRAKLLLMGLWPNDDPFGRLLTKPIDYYLGNNLDRIKKIKSFSLQQLKAQENSFSLLSLALSINDETDPSGSKEDYKSAIIHLITLLRERLQEIIKNPPEETKLIDNFATATNELSIKYDKIIKGEIDLVKTLQGADTYWGSEPPKTLFQVKHLEFSFALQISNVYYLVNTLYDLYEKRKFSER